MNIENYPFSLSEKEWQKIWQENKVFKLDNNNLDKKYYVLEMFPYPSGDIHMGHLRNYTIGDALARFKKMQGYQVMHPMGFDSFGLPAENAAIEKKIHPKKWTKENIKKMKKQLQEIGFSYDWDRELATCDQEYYKYEQKFFLEFLKKNIAYRKETFVNWDPVDNTILANEQVIDGRGWRSGAIVEKKKINSWFLKISDYCEELLQELDNLKEWPNSVISMQKKWIGKSQGAMINFDIFGRDDKLEIYTTRPETIFGASFCAIAAQHPLAIELSKDNSKIQEFINQCNQISTAQEDIDKAEKLGFDTGLKIIHPFNKNKVIATLYCKFCFDGLLAREQFLPALLTMKETINLLRNMIYQ